MSRAQGWCEQGGKVIVAPAAVGSSPTSRGFQQSYKSCTVTVYLTGTATLATIYSNSSGSALANPFTADQYGVWFFYAHDGRYDVQISGGGPPALPAPYTFGDISLLDPALFAGIRLMGDPNYYPTIAAAYAAAPSTGGWIMIGPGSFTEPAAITLTSAKPLHLTCMGQGSGTSGTGGAGITLIGFNSAGYLFQIGSSVAVDSVTIDNCAFLLGSTASGWFQAGVTSEPAGPFRYGWAFTNVTVTGPGGNVGSTVGAALSNLAGLTLTNFTVQGFTRPALFDRNSVVTGSHVRFNDYSLGPLITRQAGAGGSASYSAQMILSNPEFLGPDYVNTDYAVTVDQSDVEFLQAIYEPNPGVATRGAVRITANGRNFRDFGGFFSVTTANPTYLMVWDDQSTEMAFFGTMFTGNPPAPPICYGAVPGCAGGPPNNTGSPPVCMGCGATLYSQFQALGPAKAIAFGSPPLSYGAFAAITGPAAVDVPASGDFLRGRLNVAGAANQTLRISMPMPDSGSTVLAATAIETKTESASAGAVAAGICLRTGTNSATACGEYVDSAGNATVNQTITMGVTGPGIFYMGLPTAFASLGSPADYTIIPCSNCTANSNPCTAGGTGAIAKRLAGAWDCR